MCPKCGAAPVEGNHCETPKGHRNPGASTGQHLELPPAVGASKLFQVGLEALLRDAESLASRVESYQDKRIPGADVYPGVQAFLRYLPDGDGGRREMYTEEEWQELCKQFKQPSDVEDIMIPDSIFRFRQKQRPRHRNRSPP